MCCALSQSRILIQNLAAHYLVAELRVQIAPRQIAVTTYRGPGTVENTRPVGVSLRNSSAGGRHQKIRPGPVFGLRAGNRVGQFRQNASASTCNYCYYF
jgi:hypothetical protein